MTIKYRVSQTHRSASQFKTFSSTDGRWTADGRAAHHAHWLVEKLRRIFKCHRSSLDFDFKFIRDA